MRQLVIRRGRSEQGVVDLARGLILYALLPVFLFGCQGKTPLSPQATASTALIQPSPTVLLESAESPLFPALTPVASEPTSSPEVVPVFTDTPYPIPGEYPASGVDSPYPGIEATESDSLPYPGSEATASGIISDPEFAATITALAYPSIQETPSASIATEATYPLPLASATAIQQVLPTSAAQTPGAAITPVTTVTTERVIQPLGTPPTSSGTVTIWHAWNSAEATALMQVIASFQKSYPDVRFDVLVLPESELLTRYEVDAYNGSGPTLLIGPSDWTAYLLDRQLVEDLYPYVSPAFSRTVYPAALKTGNYQDQLACLPLNLFGALLYRNTQILPEQANTMEELLTQAEAATRAGKVGAYLERGFTFSFAHLYGLGGGLVDESGAPKFQEQDYRYSLAWVDLLETFAQPGAFAFNDEKDTSLFKQNRAGYLIDGSWNLPMLAEAIGSQNLAIDPWPAIAQGNLSGYVKAESLYLNVNTSVKSTENHLATLRFMGYLMTAPVQEFLAEHGFIPSLLAAYPRDPLLAQAHMAFARGTAYPSVLFAQDSAIRLIYQDTLDAALMDIFQNGVTPRAALEKALHDIEQRLDELK